MLISRQPRHLNSPRAVALILKEVLDAEGDLDRDKEHFWVINLDSRYHTKSIHLVHLGSMNNVDVHPREVFRPAVQEGAHAVILAHNHPGGNTTPSEIDIGLNWRLVEAGKILGIEVMDHLVVNEEGEYTKVPLKDEEGND